MLFQPFSAGRFVEIVEVFVPRSHDLAPDKTPIPSLFGPFPLIPEQTPAFGANAQGTEARAAATEGSKRAESASFASLESQGRPSGFLAFSGRCSRLSTETAESSLTVIR